MSTRENIISAIMVNQPELMPLPVIDFCALIHYEDTCAQFASELERIGGKVNFIQNLQELKEMIMADKASCKFVVDAVAFSEAELKWIASLTASELQLVEKVYIKGAVGVAENGAVWVDESRIVNRLLPFICQHLVLIVERNDIVPTLHHAYSKINTGSEGFGAFIAGPSKTADIEQSLVLGAHGARTATVYVVG